MKIRTITQLNIRNSPDRNNPRTGIRIPNVELEVEQVEGEKVKDTVNGKVIESSVWYKDATGDYYWGGGVEIFQAEKSANEIISTAQIFSDFWFNELGILQIWNEFSERGENAKALILDSGINTDLTQINSAIQDPTKNFVQGSVTIKDSHKEYHGTHCSSIIAARSNNQYIGASPETKIYIGKITEAEDGSLENSNTMKDALKEFSKDVYQFDIISISQELISEDIELKELIGQHLKKSRIVIASIGNDPESENRPFKRYPGSFEECISVGSCTNDRTLSLFSMNPDNTNIFCYGEKILSYKDTSEPKPLSGTSQSTAIVTGICCLIVSWLKKNSFSYDYQSIRNLLKIYSSNLIDNSNLRIIQPIAIFKKLQKFKNYEDKNLQHCIDADHLAGS